MNATQKTLYLVFSSPVAGQEQAFDRWYSQHVREVLRVKGFASGRRMAPANISNRPKPEFDHLVVYEISGDVERALVNFADAVAAGDISKPDPKLVALPMKSMIYVVTDEPR